MQLLNKCYEKVTKFVTKNKELIYIMPLIIFVLTSILSDKTNFANKLTMQMSVIRYICLFIILIKIIICDISKYNKKTIIKIFFLGIITTIVSIIIDSRILIQYLIIIIGAYNIKIENIFRNILIFETMLVFFIIILSALGVVPNYVVTRGNTSNVIRNSLGFEFGTYPAIFTFYLTLLYLYYRKDKIKVYEYIVLFFINFIIYRLTDTRTDFICSVMIILASLLYSRMKNENIINKIAIITSKYIMIFLTLLSLILTISYNENNPNMKKMNSVLSRRLEYSQKGINNYGITLFGNKIEWIDMSLINTRKNTIEEYNCIDCAYINILVNYGIIVLFLLIYAFYSLTKKQIRQGDIFFCYCIIVISIHSFINPQLLQIVYNIFLVMLVKTIVSTENRNIKEQLQSKERQYSDFLTIDEIHKEQVLMLKEIIEFCNKNSITYYICGGTLLGAIRHKGFIPWDDDIDLLMPRKEFEKFEEISKENGYKVNDKLIVNSYDLGNLHNPFIKVMNPKIEVDNHYIQDEYEKYLWIDIFPMDGLPENTKKTNKIYKKILLYRKILSTVRVKNDIIENESKNKKLIIIKKIIRVVYKIIGIDTIVDKIDTISKKYDYDKSKYVGGVCWGYGPQEKLLKKNVKNIKVKFEELEVNTFACYDEYLTNLYGNYMELPPVEKRIVHGIKVRKILKE